MKNSLNFGAKSTATGFVTLLSKIEKKKNMFE